MSVVPVCNAFTVDVEDYFHVTAFEKQIDRADWPSFESRVVRSTHVILELLRRKDVRGTFFVLGWVAEHYPQLVRDIAAQGHEIGSHSYWHRLVYDQTPQQFREDVRRARDVLQDITAAPVTCYRAPSFSITSRSLWALKILVEEGFTVDSSIAPVRHDRYGIAGANESIHQLETLSGPIWEFPPSVMRMAGLRMGLAGGGYFRLFPFGWTKSRMSQIIRTTGQPLMFYIHPWEVDVGQPKLSLGSRLSRLRHRVNLDKTMSRLEELLEAFRFSSMKEAMALLNTPGDRNLAPQVCLA